MHMDNVFTVFTSAQYIVDGSMKGRDGYSFERIRTNVMLKMTFECDIKGRVRY